jgi:hypothetical protein
MSLLRETFDGILSLKVPERLPIRQPVKKKTGPGGRVGKPVLCF